MILPPRCSYSSSYYLPTSSQQVLTISRRNNDKNSSSNEKSPEHVSSTFSRNSIPSVVRMYVDHVSSRTYWRVKPVVMAKDTTAATDNLGLPLIEDPEVEGEDEIDDEEECKSLLTTPLTLAVNNDDPPNDDPPNDDPPPPPPPPPSPPKAKTKKGKQRYQTPPKRRSKRLAREEESSEGSGEDGGSDDASDGKFMTHVLSCHAMADVRSATFQKKAKFSVSGVVGYVGRGCQTRCWQEEEEDRSGKI